jgi:hypothetical protein
LFELLINIRRGEVSGKYFISIDAPSFVVVNVVSFTFLRFEASIPFVNSLLSNFPSFDGCLK